MPLIEIENVSKRYGSVRALENVSLRMEGSGIMGLLGQNGAGKTTLINILTGYLAPTSGRALLGGHDPLMEPGEAKRHLGYLPEQPPLYDEMTVREYLRFVAALKGVAARAIPAHVDEVMELTGLTSMQSRLLGHLSKGFRQRAGMAQALCGDPDVLVLDEPTAGAGPPADHRNPRVDSHAGQEPHHPVFLAHLERSTAAVRPRGDSGPRPGQAGCRSRPAQRAGGHNGAADRGCSGSGHPEPA